MINKLIYVFAVLIVLSCNSKQKKMISEDKIFLNRQVLFYVFDRNGIQKYLETPRTDMFSESSLKELKDDILKSKLDSTNEYFKYYNKYNQPIDFFEWGESKKEDMTKILNKQIETKNTFDSSDQANLIKECFLFKMALHYFKTEWYLRPEILFSKHFYDHYFSSERELIFNHQAYGLNTRSHNFLPLFLPLADKDITISQPHEIPSDKAQYLLNILIKNSENNDEYKSEYSLFKEMLEGVIIGKFILVIRVM